MMKLPFPQFTHCIDTNAIIDIKRRKYPPDVFESLSKNLDDLISKGALIAPREVFKELASVDDEIFRWAKAHKKLFKDLDSNQIKLATDIMSKFPKLVDSNKTTPDADPFIIALAISEGATVVTSENMGSIDRPKIPNVCIAYNVSHVSILDFFRTMGWKF